MQEVVTAKRRDQRLWKEGLARKGCRVSLLMGQPRWVRRSNASFGLKGDRTPEGLVALNVRGAPLASRASPADWVIVGGHFDHWVQRAIVGGRSPFGGRTRPFL